jgi:hypothetical protein
MKILAAITSPGQDDVSEKILRARAEWQPPWLRSRPARGPPASDALSPSLQEDGIEEDWTDPPAPDEGYLEDPDAED